MTERKLDKSRAWDQRARAVIAHGALTNSKRPESYVRGVYPTHIEYGIGPCVTDVDGNSYVDYLAGLGAILFGHANADVELAVNKQLRRGTIFPLGSTLEVEFSERMCGIFPYLERVRILKTGSEACSAAIRIARAATGRDLVLSEGYHGWHDQFTALTPPANGCPQGLRYDIDGMDRLNQMPRAAAVIVEPVITDASELRIQWLRNLREECTKHGAVLIFDETITGIRYESLSVAKHIGVEPDLTIFGKALGGGLPIAVVGGRKRFMDADYFVSSTFAGDTLALAAAGVVLDKAATHEVREKLHNDGARFKNRFNDIAPDILRIDGYTTRGVFKGDALALFMQEMCKAGALFGPTWFYMTCHHSYDTQVLNMCKTVLSRIRNGDVRLEGEMPVKPFAAKVRNQ